MNPLSRIVSSGTAALLLSLSAPSLLSAQGTDTRWQAWLGCWRPEATPTRALAIPPDAAGNSAPPSLVCVLPGATPTSVEIINVTNGRVGTRARIDPTGVRIPKTIDDCDGWELARWSDDNKRVMLQSEFNCANNVVRKESGLAAMTQTGEWLQVQNIKVEGNSAVYVGRLRHTGMSIEGIADGALIERPMLDEEGRLISPPRVGCTGTETATPSADRRQIIVTGAFDCGGLRRVSNAVFERRADGAWVRTDKVLPVFSTPTARLGAGGKVKPAAVIEMAQHVDMPVVEAWLADRDEPFYLSGRDLVQLADEGVSPRIIDLLVALDNPDKLSVRPTTRAVAVAPNVSDRSVASGGGGGWAGGYVDPWLNPWDPYGFRWRYGLGDVGLGYGFGRGNGYGCWGCFNPGWGNGNGVIVVVPTGTPVYSGRVVPGRGYIREGVPTRRPSEPASMAGRSIGSDRSTVGGPAPARPGGGSSSSAGGSGSSTGRTAKARGN